MKTGLSQSALLSDRGQTCGIKPEQERKDKDVLIVRVLLNFLVCLLILGLDWILLKRTDTFVVVRNLHKQKRDYEWERPSPITSQTRTLQ